MFTKRHISLILLSGSIALTGFAQSKADKKAIKRSMKDAQNYIYTEDYAAAWTEYRNVLALDKKNDVASVNGAFCIYKLNYEADSAMRLAPNLTVSKQPDAKYFLARIKHSQRSFDEAISLLEHYNTTPPKDRMVNIEETNYLLGVCKNAKYFTARPHRSIIKNIGPAINSKFQDYVPVILPDESAMYFTSKRDNGMEEAKNNDNNYFEDVYVSYRKDSVWQKAINIGEPINSETNDACVAISPDGQRMIVYRTAKDQATGDLYLTQLQQDNKWGPLEKMGEEINSQYIETSACFSNDVSEIYFSSNRPGGYGGKDIYRVKKRPDGQWAMPYNLGPTINSARDEDAPFLHPDGITLYFSSKGRNTMGEYDVFKSVLSSETNQFPEAQNLGFPINDVGNDIFFVLSVDGQRGYYSSNKKDTYGGIDIYQIDTRFGDNDLQVQPGFATINDIPGRVSITLFDAETNQLNGNYYSNSSTGKFVLVVNPLKSYKAVVEVEEEGYQQLIIDLKPFAQATEQKDLEFKVRKSNVE